MHTGHQRPGRPRPHFGHGQPARALPWLEAHKAAHGLSGRQRACAHGGVLQVCV